MAVLAVFLGGMVGTALRLGLDVATDALGWESGWSTLIVNVLGSFLLGVVVARLPARSPRWLRAGLGAGLLGSFTTFSALAVFTVEAAAAGAVMLAAGHVALSLVLGVAAAMAGLAVGPGRPGLPVASEDE